MASCLPRALPRRLLDIMDLTGTVRVSRRPVLKLAPSDVLSLGRGQVQALDHLSEGGRNLSFFGRLYAALARA